MPLEAMSTARLRRSEIRAVRICALLLVGVVPLTGCRSHGAEPAQLEAQASSLAFSEFVVGPEVPLDPARNTLWSGSIKLAWDALGDELGRPLQVVGSAPWAAILATTEFDAGDVDPDSVVVLAGRAGPSLGSAVTRALAERGSPPDPEFDQALADAPAGALFAYAEIAKTLAFETRFDDLASAPLPFQGAAEEQPTLVDAFGIGSFDWQDANHKRLHEILRYHESPDRAEFCVVLEPKSARDRIVLARVAPGATLGATWERAWALIEGNPTHSLSAGDRFAAPEIDFDLSHRFRELEGLPLLSPDGSQTPLTNVQQRLRLKLDEAGMVLRSRAFMGVGSAAIIQPRELVFDRPFLLAAYEEGADAPYLLAWIAHPELLLPAAP
ncbi:hypothetical protein [Engelhardtia mirabilis]|uniref:Serpin (Serine protease inhibitor) n=1 Tax=Engelhardtia mirabilis TaxID=2528011 RepID=A0A518BQ05_9BACT|nr:hypothetical protein Pla133_41710 [Planctomycetes bacterium Pla133]QDV03382.1 hypothetical protein Pla86_41700 [Planctomycetes bacterium Pla86]